MITPQWKLANDISTKKLKGRRADGLPPFQLLLFFLLFSLLFLKKTIICCTNTVCLAFQMTLCDLHLITTLQGRYNYPVFRQEVVKYLTQSHVEAQIQTQVSSIFLLYQQFLLGEQFPGFSSQKSCQIEQVPQKNNRKQQGPTVQHRELYSKSCNNL